MGPISNWFKRPSRPPRPTVPNQPPLVPTLPYEPTPGTLDIKRITMPHHNVAPIGMSYWRNINQHASVDVLEVCLSIGGELTILTIDKRTLEVISERSLGIKHTGEGINFSRKYADRLYYGFGKQYYRLNTMTGEQSVVWDSSYNLWQVHMDYNEEIFSASIKNDNWDIIFWGISTGRMFDLKLSPDECQIDKSGDWLCIKETRADDKLVNRFIRIATGAERIIQAEEGALGHSDCGFNCILGENSFSNVGGAVDFFDLYTGERRLMYSTGFWNLGYISLTNIHPNLPLETQKGLLSSADGRLISIKLNGLNGGFEICQIPVTNVYEHRVKANLCPNGEFFIYTAFVNDKLDAFIGRVPIW